MIAEVCRELREMTESGDVPGLQRRLIQLTHDEAQLDVMTMALELEGGDAELLRALAEARLLRGVGRYVEDLRRATRRRGQARPELVMLPSDSSEAPPASLSTWAQQAGCPWGVLAEEVPDGYAVEPDGQIHRVSGEQRAIVSREPVVVLDRGECDDTGDAYLVLGWRHGGRWTRAAARRASALSRDGLLRLADRWAPVDQVSASACAGWLSAIDCSAGEAEARRVLPRMGWSRDGFTFAWGRQALGGDAIVEVDTPEALHWRREGSWRGWVDGVWTPSAGSHAVVAILASLAAPLLHICRAPGWTLDIGQERGRGKTIAQMAAQSCWADGGALVPWPKTWPAMRNLACLFRDVPTILDDTKTAETAPRDIVDLVYQVAQGRTQVRGAVRGGIEGGETLRTIVISSGEAPIADLPEIRGAAGAEQRLLTLREAPYPSGSAALVRGVARASSESYGWAGPRLVEALQMRRERWGEIRDRYEALVAELSEGRTDGAGRIAQRSALVLLAGELAGELLGLAYDVELVRGWVEGTLAAATESDPAHDALLHVLSSLASRRSQVVGWVDPGDQREPLIGTVADGGIRVLASECDRLLRDAGYRPAEMLRAWSERRWIGRRDRGRTTMRAMLGGARQARLVDITADAVAEVGGPLDTEEEVGWLDEQ